jgi:2-polyprenyl-3-methyl-5-hydroxy-6-metoxy-1,4-benzoquinol methylase
VTLGATVRGLFGPLEPRIADAYRRYFVDLDALAGMIAGWAPDAGRVLEVGCGEGSLAERVARAMPRADVVGIDLTPRVGRLFRGDRARVAFRNVPVQTVAQEEPGAYDLVLLCDVLHHAPWSVHHDLLRAAQTLLRPGGVLVLKDWERTRSVAHLLCWSSDRFVTGDDVRYLSADELERLACDVFGPHAIEARTRVPPQPNNYALRVRRR